MKKALVRTTILLLIAILSLFANEVTLSLQQEQEDVHTDAFALETLRLGRGVAQHIIWLSDRDFVAVTPDRLWRYRLGEEPITLAWIDIPDSTWANLVQDESRLGILHAETNTTRLLLYDLNTLELVTDMQIPLVRISVAALIPDSTHVVMGTYDGEIWYFDWQANDLSAIKQGFNLSNIWTLAISPDNRQVAIGGEALNQVEIWSLETHQLEHLLVIEDEHVPYNITDVEFSPDGKFLSALRPTGTTNVHIFDLSTLESINLAPMNGASQVIYSANSEYVAVRALDTIHIWNVHTNETVLRLDGYRAISTIAFSPTSEYLAISDWNNLYIVETTSGEVVETVDEHFPTATAISYSPDGTQLVSIHLDATLRVWDTYSGTLLHEFFLDEYMDDVAFAPSGDMVAVTTGYRQPDIFLINVEDGSLIQNFRTYDSSYEVLFTPDNHSLIVTNWAAYHVFDLQSGETIISNTKFPMGSVSIGISHDGQLLAVGFGGMPSSPVRLYDTHNWEGLAGFGFFSVGGASSVAISPDNHWLVSGHCASLAFWDISSPEKISNLDSYSEPNFEIPADGECIDHIEFSADGSLLIASNRNEIRLWRTSDYDLILSIAGHSFALSSDAKQLAVTQGGSIQLWELGQR